MNQINLIQKSFGYPIDGYIGTTNQIKGWENNWIKCFINLRIEPQLAILKKLLEIDIKNKLKSKLNLNYMNMNQ